MKNRKSNLGWIVAAALLLSSCEGGSQLASRGTDMKRQQLLDECVEQGKFPVPMIVSAGDVHVYCVDWPERR